MILTNAHVVAGTESAPGGSRRRSGSRRATSSTSTPTWISPCIDAPDAPVSAADLLADRRPAATTSRSSATPRTGACEATPARIRDELVAPGQRHLRRGLGGARGALAACRRASRQLRRPGASTETARSSGVVFAASVDRDDTGYAMTSRQVASAVSARVIRPRRSRSAPAPAR